MSNTNNTKLEVGVKAFIAREGKYLILHRNEPYIGEGFTRWDIPGGRINPGEKLLVALRREIKEETGLSLKRIKKILHAQDILRDKTRHTVRITFLAVCLGRIVLDKKEHSEFKWVTIAEIKKLKHDKYLTPVIKMLQKCGVK